MGRVENCFVAQLRVASFESCHDVVCVERPDRAADISLEPVTEGHRAEVARGRGLHQSGEILAGIAEQSVRHGLLDPTGKLQRLLTRLQLGVGALASPGVTYDLPSVSC